jgi:hypothetical protein
MVNHFIVTNTKFPHKWIHKITQEAPERRKKSIIDYIIVRREMYKNVLDSWVTRGPEVGSDHYLLQMELEVNIPKQKQSKKRVQEKIKTWKVNNEETKERYQEKIMEKTVARQEDLLTEDVEEFWTYFKHIITEAAAEVCGKTKVGCGNQRKAWWNEEIKRVVKVKKQLWKRYLTTKMVEDYEKYKVQRNLVKGKVIKAKQWAWDDFGTKMEED